LSVDLVPGICLPIVIGLGAATSAGGEHVVKPKPYDRALRNPMKGFTSGSEWETLRHTYIRWNELEDKESDGIGRIRSFCDRKWRGLAERNVKAIPRVYLHWTGDSRKYWPSDMKADDYTSPEFRKRLLRLIDRLGQCWDSDPRVAFVEMGIFGKWGEHHSPSPTAEMQRVVGEAFAKAFKNKLVSVRHPWQEFSGHGFGWYWDSWAHYQQMWAHGHQVAKLNRKGLWKKTYIGGEVAYNWGDWKIQAGKTATDSVSKAIHRDYVIHSIRWLHCTQLRWISKYDRSNPEAVKGAEEIQKAFGYRFVLNEVRFSASDSLNVAFTVTNEGSAPFYYPWPVEVSLLDMKTRKPVWRATFQGVDIRTWLPGDGWTEPTWKPYAKWPGKVGEWKTGKPGWRTEPRANTVTGRFKVEAPAGRYILALGVLDPAGNLPSLRFATANYINGGRHPIGVVALGKGKTGPLPPGFRFDDPHEDRRLRYIAK